MHVHSKCNDWVRYTNFSVYTCEIGILDPRLTKQVVFGSARTGFAANLNYRAEL